MNYKKLAVTAACLTVTLALGCGGRSISNRRLEAGATPGKDGAAGKEAGPPDQLVVPDTGDSIPGTFKTLLGGSFFMGSPKSEPCRLVNEKRHKVTLKRTFQIMTTEVTQAMFLTVMGYAPSSFKSCGMN